MYGWAVTCRALGYAGSNEGRGGGGGVRVRGRLKGCREGFGPGTGQRGNAG